MEGDNKTRVAPDTMVVFGRPKGVRGSYKQWLEDGLCPEQRADRLAPRLRAASVDPDAP